MQNKDEEILKIKKQMEEEEKSRESKKKLEKEMAESIYDEKVHVIGEEVRFERRYIPELGISIYMPDRFFRLTDDIVKQLYPMGNTSSHVFCGDKINFHLILNQTSHQIKDTEIRGFVDVAARYLDVMGPKSRIIEKGVERKTLADDKSLSIGYVSFVSRAMDGSVYNMQFYISVQGKIIIGGMVFPSRFKKRLIPLAKEVINSIELLDEREV